MGRMIGAFDNPEELDRPDLNKCPDCSCFFAGDNCPLCGKECPEEMRAGNRKPPKKAKKRRSSSSGRVTFVEWYHSWWFIILMMFFMPIVGIILLATSPHKRSSKITFIVIACVYLLISSIGIGNIIGAFLQGEPVDTSLSREEYIGKCQAVTPEEYYRHFKRYEDKFVAVTLKISSVGYYDGGGQYLTYYVCTDVENSNIEIMVLNCLQDDDSHYVKGDILTVYGEGAGEYPVYEHGSERLLPRINMAYTEIVE